MGHFIIYIVKNMFVPCVAEKNLHVNTVRSPANTHCYLLACSELPLIDMIFKGNARLGSLSVCQAPATKKERVVSKGESIKTMNLRDKTRPEGKD